MNFERNWTSFALEAEYDFYGMRRIAAEHNRLRSELESLKRHEFICTKCGIRKDSEPSEKMDSW